MKRLIILVVLLAALAAGCTSKANINQASNADLKILEKNLQAAFAKTGQDIKVQVSELKNLKDTLPGFSFAEIKIYNKDNLVNTERVITNGQYFAKDIIDSNTLSSLKDELEFEFAKVETIDTTNLTLAGGNKNSKNVIVEITDFQCPYCKKANSLFKSELKGKSDYALYMVHLPLDMHPNAPIMAQVFEAGMQMGFNFKNDLFESDYIKIIETKLWRNSNEKRARNQLLKNQLEKLTDKLRKAKGDNNINTFNNIYLKEYESIRFKSPILQKLFRIPSTEKISIEEFCNEITVFNSETKVLKDISFLVKISPISQKDELIKLFIKSISLQIK